jgi:hypothetical protein
MPQFFKSQLCCNIEKGCCWHINGGEGRSCDIQGSLGHILMSVS